MLDYWFVAASILLLIVNLEIQKYPTKLERILLTAIYIILAPMFCPLFLMLPQIPKVIEDEV